ncbi:MAG: chromate transporter [Lachnospiraceae bacterium]|nr:chromate transporter [Lachnospiraceae bacterium]
MIYLRLFLEFLEIGAVSFGGGYGMISLIREVVLENGWLTEEELLDFIAVAESTPGPIAVNIATFIGSSQGGILGSAAATFGVVLPAFVIILLIAAVLKNVHKYRPVQGFIEGIKPAVVALITGTTIVMGLSAFLGFDCVGDAIAVNVKAIALFAVLVVLSTVFKKVTGKNISPIAMIVFSGVIGVIFMG